MGPVSSRPSPPGHLRAVPDPAESARSRTPEPGLFDLPEPEPDPAPSAIDERVLPDDVTAADIRRMLADMGAPADLQEAVLEFGDDTLALTSWLTEIGAFGAPDEVLTPMLAQWEGLLERGVRAIEAEVCTGEFLYAFGQAENDPGNLIDSMAFLVQEATATRRRAALAMSRCLIHLGPPEIQGVAAQAAHELVRSGIKDMPWVKDLGKAEFVRAYGYGDEDGRQESVIVEFRHGKRVHAIVALIDHELGGGFKDLFAGDDPRGIFNDVRMEAMLEGFVVTGYQPVEVAARLHSALTRPVCAEEPEQAEDVGIHLPILLDRLALLPEPSPAALQQAADRAKSAARPKRRRSKKPVPEIQLAPRTTAGRTPVSTTTVHRIKVTLAGSKPPIWRRLEVPSTITLHRLHDVLQAAFGWTDTHLWAFEDSDAVFAVGEIGAPHRNARRVVLGQIAPTSGDTVRYVYDFGDDWDHRILVEAVDEAAPDGRYPRCLTGRRATPPEDCGGVWGYQDLVDSLADPGHPEHRDRLAWLGLDAAGEFDPARFDQDAIDRRLATLAGRRR